MTIRKSEGAYYRRSGVTPVEERPPGKIDLGKETLWDQQSLENQRKRN
jgi:hypothetical protein